MKARPLRTDPPRVARALLRWSLPDSEAPYVLSDLDERFEVLCRTVSRSAARRWYWRQALAAIRVRRAWPRPEAAGVVGDQGLIARATALPRALRIAVRSLARRPVLSAVSILALALGVGATTTAFSVLWGTVLRGLPFEDAHRLVHFERQNVVEDRLSMAVTPHDYVAWRDGQGTFEGLGAFVEAVAHVPADAGPPARYDAVSMTANAFDLLRSRPLLGRTFTADEDRPGGPAVVVVGYGLWERHFGGDADVVGREIRLNGRPTTVVGVMPEGFGFPIAEQLWLPLQLDLSRVQRGEGRLDVFGRLRDGVSLAEARVEIEGISSRLSRVYPETNANVGPSMQTFQAEYVGEDFTTTVYRMLAGAFLVLLVACANVANLLLARARERSRELAVRIALGAGRGRVLGALLAEAAVLTTVGAVLGIALAHAGVAWFEASGTEAGVFPLPHGTAPLFWWDVRVDGTALVFVLAVTVVTALAAGILPGLLGASTDPAGSLRSAARGAFTRGAPVSSGLVVGEVALTTGLLVVAGLLLRSVLAATAAVHPVFTDDVVTARMELPRTAESGSDSEHSGHADRLAVAEQVIRTLAEEPGIRAVAVATQMPTERPHSTPFSLPDGTYADETEQPRTWVTAVSDGFFELFEVDVRQGRPLGPEDGPGTTPVAVVNESFVARFYGNRDPVNERIRLGGPDSRDPWTTIVGVVPDLWTNTREPDQHTVYVPLAQSGTSAPDVRLGPWGFLGLAVRGPGDAATASQAIRQGVFRTDPSVPVYRVRSMADVIAQSTGRYRIWSRFYAAFAVVALFLAAVGLYGIVAFGVSARTAEIGIRRALGAPKGEIVRSVLHTGVRYVLAGAAIGLLLALWLTRGIDRMLFRVDPGDPAVFAVVLAVVMAVGLLASFVPALRAASVEPSRALRVE